MYLLGIYMSDKDYFSWTELLLMNDINVELANRGHINRYFYYASFSSKVDINYVLLYPNKCSFPFPMVRVFEMCDQFFY